MAVHDFWVLYQNKLDDEPFVLTDELKQADANAEQARRSFREAAAHDLQDLGAE
jgi:hypothetical protein